jgi:hypothetical protein
LIDRLLHAVERLGPARRENGGSLHKFPARKSSFGPR